MMPWIYDRFKELPDELRQKIANEYDRIVENGKADQWRKANEYLSGVAVECRRSKYKESINTIDN
jgi:hypothetical protein